VLVDGFQHPEVDAVPGRVDRQQVGSEQDPVGMPFDQRGRAAGLAAELGDAGRDVDEDVRVARQQRVDPGEVLGVAADVGTDEGRRGMRGDRRFEGIEEPAEPGRSEVRLRDRRVAAQLVDALVEPVGGMEERERVGGVHHHRQPEGARRLPHRREERIVAADAAAVDLPAQAEVLPYLQAARAGACRFLERSHQRRGSAGPVELRPVEVAEREEPARMGAVVAIEVVLQLAAPTAVEVHDRLEVAVVHHLEERVDPRCDPARVGGEPPPEVRVRVDRGHTGAAGLVLGQHEHRARFEPVEPGQGSQQVAHPARERESPAHEVGPAIGPAGAPGATLHGGHGSEHPPQPARARARRRGFGATFRAARLVHAVETGETALRRRPSALGK